MACAIKLGVDKIPRETDDPMLAPVLPGGISVRSSTVFTPPSFSLLPSLETISAFKTFFYSTLPPLLLTTNIIPVK